MFPRVFGCLLIVLLAGDFAFAQKTTPPPKPAATPAAKPAGPAPIVLPSNNQDSVQMQFPNSDVKDILSLYERLTHKKVVFDNSVQGPVNIVINQMVPREEAIKIIEINLLLNGFSIVPEDENIVKVTGVGKNPRSAGVPVYSDAELLPEGDRVVTFVFNLKYADPTELQTMLAPYITTGGSQYTSIVALPKAQALLITENTAVIRTLIKIVQSVDVPPAEVVSEFIPLERADAKDVLEKLEKIFEKTQTGSSGIPRPAVMPAAIAGQPAGAQAGGSGSVEINAGGPSEESLVAGKIKLTADVRTNRIHVVTRPVNLPFVRKLVKEFDDDIAFAEPKIRNLKYILAGDVLPVVVKAITEPGVKPDDSGANGQNGQNGQRTATGATTTGATGAGGGGIGGAAGRTSGGSSGGAVSITESLQTPPIDTTPLATTVGNTKIIADRRANTIIVLGNEAVTQKVFKVLDEMDVRAPQVMLNTVIGELQLTNATDTGIDLLAFLNQAGGSGATSGSNGVIGTTASPIQNGFLSTKGLSLGATAITDATGITNPLSQFAVATNTLQGTVHALESTGKFRVTQRPTVFTSNNKKAVIASGEEIGIPSTTLTSLNTVTNGQAAVASSVQYQQVLLQLEVVPLINSDREVSLDILQQIDDLSGQVDTIGGNPIPRIDTRYIRTNVLIANGQTVVLGGLIKKSSQRSSGGPPWIGNIPILGQLFRRNQNTGERDELIILIRPVVTISPKEDLANSEREQEHLMIPPDLESTLDPNGTTIRVGKPVVQPVTPQPMLRFRKMSSPLRKSLVDLLVASGCENVDDAATLASTPAGGESWTIHVLNSGKVDEQRFVRQLGELFKTPVETISAERLDRTALSLLPSKFVFKHHILPLDAREDRVRLGTYDVFNGVARRLAEQLLAGKKIEWLLVPRSQLLRALKTHYGVGAEAFDEILKAHGSFEAMDQGVQAMDLSAEDPEASVVKFVNQIIREALFERATDIHVEPLENDLRIRYRIDGILHEVAVPQQLRLLQSAIISRLKVMAHMDIAEKRLPQDGRINLQHGEKSIDVRVSTIPTVNGESISLRLLTRDETQEFGFERLDLSEKQTKLVHTLLQQPNGIILVTGPTGSGKSTSLYSFLSSINSVQRRIITVEEPVEYRLPGVSQIDVKPDIGLTFANGLRAILRQDPNVVMVGEIRDFETAEIAIRAAMTGHLVFSTLHTNDAVTGITRLLDMGIEPFLLASTVRAFIAQRLVRTTCRDCGEEVDYLPNYLKEIGFPVSSGTRFKRGKGCDTCRQTGYRGRAAIYEICAINENLRRLIVQKATGTELKACAVQDGMESLRSDGWRRVLKGQTTIEEVVRVTQADELMAETEASAE